MLVGVTVSPPQGVLLTRRSPALSRHAGQVSFPGGRIDPGDASIEDAALREAFEEIGLPRDAVEVVGRLSPFLTGTGFRIWPVTAIVQAHAPLLSAEVTHVFELPLAVLLDPAAPRSERVMYRGAMRTIWRWPHDEHEIWGATAGILVELAGRLGGGY